VCARVRECVRDYVCACVHMCVCACACACVWSGTRTSFRKMFRKMFPSLLQGPNLETARGPFRATQPVALLSSLSIKFLFYVYMQQDAHKARRGIREWNPPASQCGQQRSTEQLTAYCQPTASIWRIPSIIINSLGPP